LIHVMPPPDRSAGASLLAHPPEHDPRTTPHHPSTTPNSTHERKENHMKGKIVFAAGAATGYVLGSRAGRSAYERIKVRASKFWNSDQVQSGLGNAKSTIADKAPVIRKKAHDAVDSAKDSATDSAKDSATS